MGINLPVYRVIELTGASSARYIGEFFLRENASDVCHELNQKHLEQRWAAISAGERYFPDYNERSKKIVTEYHGDSLTRRSAV